MSKRLITFFLILLAAPLFSQTIDLSGSWDAYKVSVLSRYSLKEYQSAQNTFKSGTMTLNTDGTVTSDIQNWTAQKWQMDEGFLMLITPSENLFYYPRELSNNIYFLVQVDVLEKNEEIISIATKSLGNLLIVKQ